MEDELLNLDRRDYEDVLVTGGAIAQVLRETKVSNGAGGHQRGPQTMGEYPARAERNTRPRQMADGKTMTDWKVRLPWRAEVRTEDVISVKDRAGAVRLFRVKATDAGVTGAVCLSCDCVASDGAN